MYNITSEKMEKIERVVGILGIVCFFFPYITAGTMLIDHKVSGFMYLWGYITHIGEADPRDTLTILLIVGALIAGIVGVTATFSSNILSGGIANTAAAGFLLFMREYITSESSYLRTGIGWTLSFAAFLVAAVCGFIAVFLAGKEPHPNRDKTPISSLDDDALRKLKEDLAKFRVNDEDKK